MSTAFQLPEWFPVGEPPPSPPVDDHRIEAMVNRFIAGKQEALFTAPDAFYRRSGGDAVDGAPAAVQRLHDLKSVILEQARDDGERAALGPRLDLHIDDANDGIDRHVAQQRLVQQRQILSERQALILRAAELEHDNDDKIAGLAEANASAAGELARLDRQPEVPAGDEARSAVWRTAIGQRVASAKVPEALALFDRVKNQLAPADLSSLDTPMQAARHELAADQWIAGQTGTDGQPLQQRVDSDASLPPEAKAIVRAKVDAQESAGESARAVRVQALDDEARAAMYDQAVNPRAYQPGTFARLADAYEAAGAPESAAFARRLGTYDAFIASFAQASAAKQRRMIDELPEEWRPIAAIIQDRQAAAFAQDAFAAGTTLYKEVGPPVPIDDIQGRIRQARQIAQLRGGIPVIPFTAHELAGMKRTLAREPEAEQQAVQARLARLPDDMRAMVEVRLTRPSSHGPANGAGSTLRVEAGSETAIDEPSPAGSGRPPAKATATEGAGEFGGAPQPGPTPGQQATVPNEGRAATSGGQNGSFATEPAPGSDVYRTAEAKARDEQVKEKIATDRAISGWLAKAKSGQSIPSELVDGLSPGQKRQIEELISGGGTIKTDPAVLDMIVNGLKSRNPETQRDWAQAPLYRYRSQLSASDFKKVVELQDDLDSDSGYSRSEIARIRKQLADRPDTSDLDGFYETLAPDPDVQYGEILPIGVDSNGKIRWFVLPGSARRFLKGFLDLLKGTKTGELTPEAIETFTGITGGAGRAFGARGDGATFGAGGTRRPLSEAERQLMRERFEKNKAAGRQLEVESEVALQKEGREVAGQVTIRLPEGDLMVADILTRDPKTGKVGCKECKAGEKPTYKPAQRDKHRRFGMGGGTIVGEGRPGFPGGTELPPTPVDMIRDR